MSRDETSSSQPDDPTTYGPPGPAETVYDVLRFDVAETILQPHTGHTTCLVDCQPFSLLSPRIVALIENHMSEQSFAAGEALMRQGAPGGSLMVITEGVVEVCVDDGDGRRHFIQRVGPGQVLGEMSLLTDEPRSAHAVATEAVRALVLPAETFNALAAEHPGISVALTQLLALRLGQRGRDVLAGKVFEGYRIRQRLGRGGMAVVYEAEDLDGGRRVALKMMSHRLVYDRAALEQFQREADMIERFEHPNIARTFGRFAAFHTFFIVMEFCDGQTLTRRIQENGPLGELEFRRIMGQLAGAVRYAHQAGVVHRDIKPPNIMLRQDGSVVLMDFGLAKPMLDDDSGPEGLIVGTPRYMAPEQMAGRAVDERADYFALGAVAWEMLCGRPLFEEKNAARLRRQRRRWQPPDVRAVLPGQPEEILRFLQTSLALDPAERRLDLEEIARWA
ncbi:MAG TPA: protein kinase [Planctomycetaceae bacterium]|nr:protein kinase [Planctomycetaceae bacterium]